MAARADDSLETMGRRLALFGRLIDESVDSVSLAEYAAGAHLLIDAPEPARRVA